MKQPWEVPLSELLRSWPSDKPNQLGRPYAKHKRPAVPAVDRPAPIPAEPRPPTASEIAHAESRQRLKDDYDQRRAARRERRLAARAQKNWPGIKQ